MLSIDSSNRIQLTRGDTAYIAVPIYDSVTEKEYTMKSGDVLKFTVKKSTKGTDPVIFQKVATGENSFHIEPDDTSDLDYGRYKYDIQLTKENGDVFTVIVPSVFEVAEEVTT